jgi:hypothetical protein
MVQASSDAKEKTPVIAHKKNNHPWLCILKASDFLEILRRSDLPVSTADYKAAIESL